jgi:hypothetical protein
MRLHLLLVVVGLAASGARAGKPMPLEVSLAELAARSDAVLLVEWASPPERRSPNDEGCEELRWRLLVKRVVRSRLDTPLARRATIEVVANLSALFDCHLRLSNPSGGSFSAPRYRAPADAPPARGPFLVFVRSAPAGLVLAADDGWEVAGRAGEVEGKRPP